MRGNLVRLSEQERDIYIGPKEKKQKVIKTKTVIPKGQLFPVSYSFDSNTGSSFDLKLEDGKIIRTIKDGNSNKSVTPLEHGMLMLDLSAFHTIDHWINNYNEKKGGKQVFQTYLLPSATTRKISIVPSDIFLPKNFTGGIKLKNYEIEVTDRLTILLWVDSDNRLYRMFVKGPDIDIVRTDLYDQIKKNNNQEDKRS